jgi:hypothetical protein
MLPMVLKLHLILRKLCFQGSKACLKFSFHPEIICFLGNTILFWYIWIVCPLHPCFVSNKEIICSVYWRIDHLFQPNIKNILNIDWRLQLQLRLNGSRRERQNSLLWLVSRSPLSQHLWQWGPMRGHYVPQASQHKTILHHTIWFVILHHFRDVFCKRDLNM